MCTTIGFSYPDGYIFGRTLEITTKMDHSILYVPAGQEEFIKTSDSSYESRFATLGMSFLGMPMFGDGINEMGLMASNNLLPGYASFAEEPVEGKVNLTIFHAFSYLLTRCKDVHDVQREAARMNIIAKNEDGEESMGMHFFFTDNQGNGLVLEPKNGVLMAYDNPYGVLTNAPEFPWHTTNLKNYLHLQSSTIDSRPWNGTALTKLGEGSGLAGLPGDFTPPSRFVRAAFFVSATPRDLDRSSAILQGFRILSQSDIPTGAVIDHTEGNADETLYTSIMDTERLAYYVKCRENINLQSYSLADFKDSSHLQFVPLVQSMEL